MEGKLVSSTDKANKCFSDFGSGMFSDQTIILQKITPKKLFLLKAADVRKGLWEIIA